MVNDVAAPGRGRNAGCRKLKPCHTGHAPCCSFLRSVVRRTPLSLLAGVVVPFAALRMILQSCMSMTVGLSRRALPWGPASAADNLTNAFVARA